MLRCATVILAFNGAVDALQVAGGAQRPRSGVVRMHGSAEPPAAPMPGAEYFEEEPPPSWGSPEWQWGSASGAAHDAALKLRDELGKPHRRSAFVTYAKNGSADVVDLKLALALTCQSARNGGYDAPDGRWEALMEEMAAVKYESDNVIDLAGLATACNERLAAPLDAEVVQSNPCAPVAAALVELEFVKKGM